MAGDATSERAAVDDGVEIARHRRAGQEGQGDAGQQLEQVHSSSAHEILSWRLPQAYSAREPRR